MSKPDFGMIEWTDAQMDEMFLRSEMQPLDGFVNGGAHQVDLELHEIFNDQQWKGFMPKELLASRATDRLSLGFAKRLWTLKRGFGAETRYFGGTIATGHSVKEITLDRQTHDLPPGKYILLGYTDKVLGQLFYDLVKPISDDLMLFRGYTGHFPDGIRGWTAVLLRRYPFAQMGIDDHALLYAGGTVPTEDALVGSWQLDALYHANRPARIARLQVERAATGALQVTCDTTDSGQGPLLPKFVADHFQTQDLPALLGELRAVDGDYMVGTWTTDLRGPSSTLLLASAPGLFHKEKGTGRAHRYALYYLLTRIPPAASE